MNAPILLPEPDILPLPAPAPLLHGLLLVTFLLHLLAMNALLGSLLIGLWARLRGGPARNALADTLAGPTPTLTAATVTLGVAPLLFLQTLMGQFLFTSSILMAWSWFSLVIVLLAAYYANYLQALRGARLGAARLPLLAATAAGFLWIAFLFSNNTSLMLAPERWAALYFADPRGLHLNLSDPTLWPRWLHAVLGAVAIAGLALALWGGRRLRRGEPGGEPMLTTGLRTFTWLTGLNLLAGTGYFLAQPGPIRKLLMGGSIRGAVLLGLGCVLGIGLFAHGLKLARRAARVTAPRLWPLAGLTLASLVAMVLLRDVVRAATLGAHYRPETFAVQTQTLNLALFAALLAGGVAVTAWMVRQLAAHW